MDCGSFPPYDQVLNPDDACLSVVDVKVLSTPQFVYLISQYPGMFGNPCCRLLFSRCNRPGGGNHRLYSPNEQALWARPQDRKGFDLKVTCTVVQILPLKEASVNVLIYLYYFFRGDWTHILWAPPLFVRTSNVKYADSKKLMKALFQIVCILTSSMSVFSNSSAGVLAKP